MPFTLLEDVTLLFFLMNYINRGFNSNNMFTYYNMIPVGFLHSHIHSSFISDNINSPNLGDSWQPCLSDTILFFWWYLIDIVYSYNAKQFFTKYQAVSGHSWIIIYKVRSPRIDIIHHRDRGTKHRREEKGIRDKECWQIFNVLFSLFLRSVSSEVILKSFLFL